MSKIFCILFLCLFTVSGVFAQGKGAVSFFCEVDTAFRQVHVGNEVQLCYLSNRKMEKHTPPVWEAGEVERVSGPHAMTSSRMETVNGNSEVVSLQGFYYVIRFLKPGTFKLPVITTVIAGNTYTCEPAVIRVLPAESSEGVVCTLTVEPPNPKSGQEFLLILTCNRKPDPRTPTFYHPDIDQLSSSGTSTTRNGQEKYRFVYKMKAKRPGSYIITPLDLTFGGTEYPMKTYQLDVESGNCLWAFIVLFVYIGLIIRYWMQFRRERNQELAAFVIRTGRMNLSVDNATTHYGLTMFFSIFPIVFSGMTVYNCLLGTPLYNPPLFCLGIVGVPFLLGALFAYTQYRKLFFRKVETNLSIDELYDLIQKLGAANDWYSEHAGNDCFVGHTSRGFLGSSWGEQIFVVFDKGQVWINSICDLQQRAAITSFGRTKKNIRLLEEAIEEAETEKHKTKQN